MTNDERYDQGFDDDSGFDQPRPDRYAANDSEHAERPP